MLSTYIIVKTNYHTIDIYDLYDKDSSFRSMSSIASHINLHMQDMCWQGLIEYRHMYQALAATFIVCHSAVVAVQT